MENSRGFTLIELMVTIAVLAVITMMAAPSFRTMQINQKLKLSVMEMKTAIQQGRSRSILTRSPTVICPSTVAQATCGANITNYSSLSDTQKADSVLLPEIDGLVSIKSGSDNNFLFNPQGITANKTITLCGSNKSFAINVDGPGVITVTEGGAC
ncbi:MAG: GspH/FimT family pseudopilin [Acinetobacter sp.]